MKTIAARRIIFKVGNFWESPALHVLLTSEEGVVVARCLDFRVSSHGEDEKDAIESLADAVKEYVITSVENDAGAEMYDPAHGKFCRMFNEMESRQTIRKMEKSLKNSFVVLSDRKALQSPPETAYAWGDENHPKSF